MNNRQQVSAWTALGFGGLKRVPMLAILSVLCVLSLPAEAASESPPVSPGSVVTLEVSPEARLISALEKTKTFYARFEQTQVSPSGRQTRMAGQLWVKRPGQLLCHGLKGAAIGYDSGLECDAVKVAASAEVLAVKQICRYPTDARSGRRGCDIVGVDLDVIHVSYKVSELGYRMLLSVNILGLLSTTSRLDE